MANLKRIAKRTAIAFLGLLIGIPMLLVAINIFDEDLKPETIAFADFSEDDVPAEQNGFFAWVGLMVPLGQEPHQRGIEIISQVNERLDATLPKEIVDRNEFLGPRRLQFTAELAGLCDREMMGCLTHYPPRASEIERWVRENKILLDRYLKIYAYPNFRETLKPRAHAPFFYDPASVARLVRAGIALQAIRGDTSVALHRLRDDTVYWRRVLVESRTLIGRMIAVATIWANAQLVSEIAARGPVGMNALALSVEAVRPLTDTERDLSKVFRYEFSFVSHLLLTLQSENSTECGTEESIVDCGITKLSSTLLFKPNATVNMQFENFNTLSAMSRLPAHEYLKEAGERRSYMQDSAGWPWSWDLAYNPVGKIFTAIPGLVYDGYAGRIHNLDGFLRLVSLQLGIKKAGVSDTDIPEFLGRAPSKLRNPYTGDPMSWDAMNRTIFFYGMSDNYDEELLGKRIELRL